MREESKRINIIFDMDGTLIDSAKIAIPAFEKVCPMFGLEMPSADIITAAVGYANPFFYYKIYPDIDKEKLLKFGKKVEEAERDVVKEVESKMLFAGVKDLLDGLLNRKFKMYIASTGDLEHVDDCLKACEIHTYFEEIHCGKPDKEFMVSEIVNKAPKENWIMIGDRRKDSKAARHSGICSVGAAYGYCSIADYKEFDCIIDYPSELVEVLQSEFGEV